MKLTIAVLLFVISTVSGRQGHTYPHSSGRSGYGSGSSHPYPSSNGHGSGSVHNYPSSNGHGSGSAHTYPTSTGLSGTGTNRAPNQPHVSHHYAQRTEVHHYHYSPPQQVVYGSTYHPVYHGTPPVYIYEVHDSGSRFDTLLTGLALYNLGRSQSHHYDNDRRYSSAPGELCKLGVKYQDGRYEETRIRCEWMSSFIWEMPHQNQQSKEVTKVTQVTNNTVTNLNGTTTSVVVKTEVVEALKDRGPSISVTPGMTCYMIRMVGSITAMEKPVDCGLLQEYARSMRSASDIVKPLKTVLMLVLTCILF